MGQFEKNVINQLNLFEIVCSQRKSKEDISNFVVSTVPADVLALLDARTSAGAVMTKYAPYMYIWDRLFKGWKNWRDYSLNKYGCHFANNSYIFN